MAKKRTGSLSGVLLIALGVFLLGRRLHWFHLGWIHIYPLILLFIGVAKIRSYSIDKAAGKLVSGAFFLLTGLFFAVRNFEVLPFWSIEQVWPILPLMLGLSFLLAYPFSPSQKEYLPIGGIFLVGGAAGFAYTTGLLNFPYVRNLWPALLILLGLVLIATSFRSDSPNP